jgi:hypothetical protein
VVVVVMVWRVPWYVHVYQWYTCTYIWYAMDVPQHGNIDMAIRQATTYSL